MIDESWREKAVADLYRSDDLSGLRRIVDELFRLPPELRALMEMPDRIPIVLDANQAYADILSKAKAVAPNYRTDIEELSDAGAIVLHAPRQIADEVTEHLSSVAAENSIQATAAQAAWDELRRRITLHDVAADPAVSITDPEDAPYVALSNALGGAIIITRDKAIGRATSNAAGPSTLGPLKRAVRLSVPIAKVQVGWILFTLILGNAGAEAMRGIAKVLSDRRVQIFILVLLGIAGVGGAIYFSKEENRTKLRERLRRVGDDLAPVLDVVLDAFQKYETMKDESKAAWQAAVPYAERAHPLPELEAKSVTPVDSVPDAAQARQ